MKSLAPILTILYLIHISDTANAAAPASQPDVLGKLVATMPDNSWLRLDPPREPDGRNSCGICLGGGKVFYFGGDRFSHDGNDVELYDLASNSWSRSWEPQVRPELGPDDKELSAKAVYSEQTGRPWAMQTFGQVCYVPSTKSFLYAGHAGTWVFDPAANKWSNPAGPYSAGAKVSPHTVFPAKLYLTFYSPQLEAPVCFLTGRPFGIYVFDAKAAEWKKRDKDMPRMMQWYGLYQTWVPTLKAHLISGAGRPCMWLYDASAEQFTVIKDVPEAIEGTQALAYDSANDAVIALEQYKVKPDAERSPISVDAWVMSTKTKQWTKLARLPAPAVQPTGYQTGAWGPLVYDADRNVFIFLNRPTLTECQTWAYRYKNAGLGDAGTR